MGVGWGPSILQPCSEEMCFKIMSHWPSGMLGGNPKLFLFIKKYSTGGEFYSCWGTETQTLSSPPHQSRCGWYKMKVCKLLSSEIEKQSSNAKDVRKCIICICSIKICYVVSCGIWIKCHKILNLTRLVSNNILHIFPNVLIKGSESK